MYKCKFCNQVIEFRKQFLKMEKFMEENDLILSTGKPLEYWVERILKLGHCSCNSDRLECPCPQAAEEIKKAGHCNCKLFSKRGFNIEIK